MSDLLDNNLDNIDFQVDLFGNKIEKLSMKDRIGFLPISIWKPDWTKTKELKEQIGDMAQHRTIVGGNNRNGKGYRLTTKNKYKTDTNIGSSGNTSDTSIFNPHLAQMILSAYCPNKAKVFNPFSGDWAMGFVASAMGHDYTGIEIRQEDVDAQKARQKELDRYFNIICGDSTKYDIEPNYYDFSYSCPPYYDLEIYSDMPEDISTAGTYEDFLEMLYKSVEVTYRGLKPGALSVWIVGNFRDKKGSLRHFSGDLVQLGKRAGFQLHDELIYWGASGSAHQRVGQFEANRRSVRVHEYIIIFKK